MTQSVSSAIWGNGNTTCRELARSKFNIYSNNNSRLFISWKINIQIIVFKNFNVRSFLKFYFRDTIDRSPSILSIDILTHSFHRFETTIVEKLICHSIITLDRFQNPKNPNIFFSPYISYPFERDHEVIQPPLGRNTQPNIFLPPKLDPPLFHLPQRSQPPPNSKVSHRSEIFTKVKTKRRNDDDDDLADVDVGETVGSLRFKLVASHRPPLPRTILESSIRGRLSLPPPRLFFASSPLSFSSLVHSINFTDPPSLFIPPSKGAKIILRVQGREGKVLVLESF